jgi:5-formyltetrahydrofolate cyclo-ligase
VHQRNKAGVLIDTGARVTDISAVAAAKKELRSIAKRIRSEVPQQQRAVAAEAVAAHGIAFAKPRGTVVSGFSAIGEEIDPLPLMLRLAREGYRLALPVVQGNGLPLAFRRWQPGDPLVEGRWGIREPKPSAAESDPDVILVPLLAFDAAGHRLGYGGGFYDRTLAMARARKPVVAIGLAYDCQEVPVIPRLDFDQRLDWVLTPSGPRRCKGD